MKFIALTFDYNINKLESIGRHWSKDVYKEKNFIFEYSAASYASFLHFNPDEKLYLLTDDVELLQNKLSIYNINLDNVTFVDWQKELKEYTKDKYAFRPLIELVKYFKNSNDYIIKLDNDLICKQKVNFSNLKDEVLVWKLEGLVAHGDPRWGEKLVCNTVVNNTNFIRYNVGVLGLPPSFWKYHEDYLDVCQKMIDVDISGVTDVNSKIYHCCEQTAYNWIFYKYNYTIFQTYNLFDHLFDKKGDCIEQARKYRKI